MEKLLENLIIIMPQTKLKTSRLFFGLLVVLLGISLYSCSKDKEPDNTVNSADETIIQGDFNFNDNFNGTIIKTSDQGYLLSLLTLDQKINIIKLNGDFSVQWSKFYYNGITIVSGTTELGGGNFGVLYTKNMTGDPLAMEAHLLKISASGDIIWDRKYDYFNGSSKSHFISRSFNNYFWSFVQFDNMLTFPRILAIKHNASGDTVHKFIFTAGNSMCAVHDFIQIAENRFYIKDGIFLENIDSTGHRHWGKNYGDTCISNMIVKTDGSVINAGADPNIPNYQVCMFKYDSTGGLTWEKNVIIGTNETVRSMCSTTDGSIFITGVISSETQEQFPYVAKILSNGSLQSKIDFTEMKGTDFKPIVMFEEGGKFLYFGYCKNYSGKSGIVIKKGTL